MSSNLVSDIGYILFKVLPPFRSVNSEMAETTRKMTRNKFPEECLISSLYFFTNVTYILKEGSKLLIC